MKILFAEDNEKISKYTKKFLENKSYIVDAVLDGEKAQIFLENKEYDLAILDIMMPGLDGISLCKNLRDKNINIPIIMLTSLGELDDKIKGLDAGADDYLVKPFSLEELDARIRALLRRPRVKELNKKKYGEFDLDMSSFKVFKKGQEIELTSKEYLVLEYLMINSGMILSRDKILNHCWDYDYEGFSNIVDVYIKRLRKKIRNEKNIKTVRGMGYSFEA